MRLQQPLYVRKNVSHIDLRIVARNLPEGAEVDITDVMLQLGMDVSGYTDFNAPEYGTVPGHTWHVNGVVHDGLDMIALANPDRPSPSRLEVLNADSDTRIASYRFGAPGRAVADGTLPDADAGWGRVPLVTQRSDLYLRPYLGDSTDRVQLRVSWTDREPGEGKA